MNDEQKNMTQDDAAAKKIPSSEDLAQLGRGVLMGGADVIPGVSGGTVALILGIYERLISAVSHVDATLMSFVSQRKFRDAAKHIDLRFIIPLGMGILVGIVLLGSVMHTLLEDYRQYTMAAFFGMIGASCLLVAKLVTRWRALEYGLLTGGAVFAVWLVSQPALANPPDHLWYIFLCGAIAICAMILPGISGSFILLILGKYHEITGIIKDVIKLKLSTESIFLVLTFACGCLVGLISFAKLLRWLLANYAAQTMSLLCGFMIGSLYKIWPFQVDTTPEVEEFKHKVFEIVPFSKIEFNGEFALTILVAIVAAVLVFGLDHLGSPEQALEEVTAE
ncbi:hypothetical protein Mal48_04180 [Thalassoglobus polymorphus]|uniref:DUF368 domain-containing protein n=2 Tax=Thalassoglobus polymorphus TaxID=2527994 RepID=A0A517QHS6_9PLAN|nr:hypothetical protein Mal48_04180 [Thalassoglobus polymorphus]